MKENKHQMNNKDLIAQYLDTEFIGDYQLVIKWFYYKRI
jgi:hypothetical protein